MRHIQETTAVSTIIKKNEVHLDRNSSPHNESGHYLLILMSIQMFCTSSMQI